MAALMLAVAADSVWLVRAAALVGLTGALAFGPVSYTHLRAHETVLDLVCRLLLEKKKKHPPPPPTPRRPATDSTTNVHRAALHTTQPVTHYIQN